MIGKLLLSQQLYIDVSLWCYSLKNTKSASSLIDPFIYLTSDQASKSTNKITQIVKIPYQEVVSTLIYITLGTHLDIAYTVQLLSYFLKNSGESNQKTI